MDVAIPIRRGGEDYIIYILDNKATSNDLTDKMLVLIIEAAVQDVQLAVAVVHPQLAGKGLQHLGQLLRPVLLLPGGGGNLTFALTTGLETNTAGDKSNLTLDYMDVCRRPPDRRRSQS